jgi:hypothetical protein
MDEMGVELDHNNRIYWVKRGSPRPVVYRHQVKTRVNVWGAIWYTGRSSLHFTSKSFDSAHYVHVLRGHLLPFLPLRRKEFLHDGVPFHWTQEVQDWLAGQGAPVVQDFPANSPDLNAIEYVWGWIKHQVAIAEPHDYQSLKEAVRAAWASLSQELIKHFIDHMATLIRIVVRGGGWDSS